jgi:hypothetical protein
MSPWKVKSQPLFRKLYSLSDKECISKSRVWFEEFFCPCGLRFCINGSSSADQKKDRRNRNRTNKCVMCLYDPTH